MAKKSEGKSSYCSHDDVEMSRKAKLRTYVPGYIPQVDWSFTVTFAIVQ